MGDRARCLLLQLAFLAACGGDDLTLPGSGDPTLTIVSGDLQSATVGELVAEPLVVRLLDGAGSPIPDATVSFRFSGDVPGAVVDPSTPATDGNGEAGANARLGSRAGDQPIDAQVTVPGQALQVRFRLTAVAKPDDGGSAGPPPGGGEDHPGDGGGGGAGGGGGGNGRSGGAGDGGGDGHGGEGGHGHGGGAHTHGHARNGGDGGNGHHRGHGGGGG